MDCYGVDRHATSGLLDSDATMGWSLSSAIVGFHLFLSSRLIGWSCFSSRDLAMGPLGRHKPSDGLFLFKRWAAALELFLFISPSDVGLELFLFIRPIDAILFL